MSVHTSFPPDTQDNFPTFNDLEGATDWALTNLESYAMHDFVRDWKETKDVSAWVAMVEECKQTLAA